MQRVSCGGRQAPSYLLGQLSRKTATLLFASLALCLSIKAETTEGRPPNDNVPNIVFILADDLGHGDIACFGARRCQIDTPHFDRLAAGGMRFTDAHANASVCVPSRKAIMTGRYPWRSGSSRAGGPWGFLGMQMPDGQHTLGTMLKTAGYRTAYVGKWHLGTLMQTTDGLVQGPENVDYAKPLLIGPPQFGFDESFILPGSLDMYPYVFAKNNQWVGQVTARKGWSAFNRVGPAAEDFEDHRVLDTFCTEAERFVEQQAPDAKRGNPFFLYLALTAPHTPLSPSKAFEGKSRIGLYGDFVMNTDHCVGRMLDVLEAHALDDNTLVIATSDHGPAPYAGRRREATVGQLKELEQEGHYGSGIYRGYKFSVYEGAFRVPYVARWPGVVPAGTECDRLIALHDLMATLAEIVGYEPRDDQATDSISILPLLRDPQAEPTRASMILQATPAFGARLGSWKLALCPGSGCAGRWGNTPPSHDAWRQALDTYGRRPKSHDELAQAPFVQLFDLATDPGEDVNLAAEHPEKIREILAMMHHQITAGRSTPGPELPNDVPPNRVWSGVPRFVWQ